MISIRNDFPSSPQTGHRSAAAFTGPRPSEPPSKSSEASELAVGQVGLLRVHAAHDGFADQILATDNLLGFAGDLRDPLARNDDYPIIIGKNVVSRSHRNIFDLDRLTEALREPVSHDVGRRGISAPDRKLDPPNERDIPAPAVDHITLHAAQLERLR